MSTDPPPAAPQLLTFKEFSAASRLSSATIHRLIKAGKLPCLQPSGKGGKLLFPVNAIELATTTLSVAPQVTAADQRVGGKRLSGPTPKWTQHRDHQVRT